MKFRTVVIVFILCFLGPMAIPGGCLRGPTLGIDPSGLKHHLPTPPGFEDEENEYDKAAKLIKDTEQRTGREAGKRLIGNAARGVMWLSSLLFIISVIGLIVGSFFGGIGRKTAIMGIALAAAGIPIGYFITVYGYIFSEGISWVILIGVFGVALPMALWILYQHWKAKDARLLSLKRADQGAPAKDVMALLPVAKDIKSQLDDAWSLLLKRTGAIQPGSIEQAAADLLEKFHLPIPNKPAA